jgi:hypothetical protein
LPRPTSAKPGTWAYRRGSSRQSNTGEPSAGIEEPFGTVVELIWDAFTAGSVSAATYDAAVSPLGVPRLIDLMSLAGMCAGTAALLAVFDMQLDANETYLLPSLG